MGSSSSKGRSSTRKLKQTLETLLARENPYEGIDPIRGLPPRIVVNPLFMLFLHPIPLIRWRAVQAMGIVVAGLGDEDLESARVIMRRLMWTLNDESGGIGWGSPEAMGEIMARHGPLAREYSRILVSYIDPEGNFLEYPPLQKGLLWGLGRLAHARPESAAPAAEHLTPFLKSQDPEIRGLAAWAATAIPCPITRPLLIELQNDPTIIEIFRDGCLASIPIAELAVPLHR